MNWSLLVAAGLVNWLVTEIVNGSELFRPLRDYVAGRREAATWVEAFGRRMRTPDGCDSSVWRWLDFLVRCALCSRVWIALASTAGTGVLVGRGVVGFVLTWFTVAAIGHFTLETVAVLRKVSA